MNARISRLSFIVFMTAFIIVIAFGFVENAYAMGNIDKGETGTCKWELYKDGTDITTLEISAKNQATGGVMDDYKTSTDEPWEKYRDQVDRIIFNNVKVIGSYSFYSFSKLSSITIKDVQRIGKFAFSHCVNVGSIYIEGDNCVIEDDAFAFCENVTMKQVTIKGVRSIGETAFEEVDCEYIELEEGLESIGWGAFNNNEALTTIRIPESCTSIGDNAFSACPKLHIVLIPSLTCTFSKYTFEKEPAMLIVRKGAAAISLAEEYGIKYQVAGDNGSYTLDLTQGKVVFSLEDYAASKDYIAISTISILQKEGKINTMVNLNDGIVIDINNDGIGDIKLIEGLKEKNVVFEELPERSIGGIVKMVQPADIEPEFEKSGMSYYGTFIFELNKANNLLYAKGRTATVKYSTLKKKNKTFTRSIVITIKDSKGKVTYRKLSGNKKITVNKKTGKVLVKKGLKKGTYPVKIKVTAAGNSQYKPGSVNVTAKIIVK